MSALEPEVSIMVSPASARTHAVCTPMQLLFRDLEVNAKVKVRGRGWAQRSILKGVSGVLEPAKLTAVLGASGAGKTTFFNVLAGYQMPHATFNGTISVNGEPMGHERMREISGFVHQDDVITPTMTVREALVFSACLRLPKAVPMSTKVRRALDVASMLNLDKSLDNTVGSALLTGISGGEKRRLSLGMQMVTNPSILFLDEPTSGLDTYTAHKVVSILSQVATRLGRTVVATIHQPSSGIFHQFDDLLVLADGQTMYLGPAQNLVAYFAKLGRVCPTYSNPSDYLFMHVLHTQTPSATSPLPSPPASPLASPPTPPPTSPHATPPASPSTAAPPTSPPDLHTPSHTKPTADAAASGKGVASSKAAALSLSRQTTAADDELIGTLLQHWKVSPEAAAVEERLQAPLSGGISSASKQGMADLPTQLWQLSLRTMRNAMRNKLVAKGKLAQALFMATVLGLLYLQVDDDRRGVQDRQGALFFLTVQSLFGSVLNVLTIFGSEKPVFRREYTARLYTLPAYFFSRWFIELPIHVLMPVASSAISYWLIGFRPSAAKFGWYALMFVLMDTAGAALGVFISCLINNLEVALLVTPMIILPLMVFSGFLVNNNSIPPYFKWIAYISPMHYGFVALAKNELTDFQIHCRPEEHCAPGYNGNDVLRVLGFDGDNEGTIAQNAAVLFCLHLGYVLLAYVSLWFNVQRLSR